MWGTHSLTSFCSVFIWFDSVKTKPHLLFVIRVQIQVSQPEKGTKHQKNTSWVTTAASICTSSVCSPPISMQPVEPFGIGWERMWETPRGWDYRNPLKQWESTPCTHSSSNYLLLLLFYLTEVDSNNKHGGLTLQYSPLDYIKIKQQITVNNLLGINWIFVLVFRRLLGMYIFSVMDNSYRTMSRSVVLCYGALILTVILSFCTKTQGKYVNNSFFQNEKFPIWA